VLVIFEIGSGFMLRVTWNAALLFVLSHIAMMKSTNYCAQPLVGMGGWSHDLFARAVLKS
jgi:hypothetical protein